MPTYYLAPDPCQSTFFIPGSNTPGNGVKVFTYAAGTTTKVSVATDSSGSGLHNNPIVLDSGGNLPSASSMYIESGVAIDVVYAPANDTDPPVSSYRTVRNVVGIPTNTSTNQWVSINAPAFLSATRFSVIGDQTSNLHIGRRIKTENTGGDVYATITSSVFTTSTQIGVFPDSGSLDSGLSAAYYGLLSARNTAMPGTVSVNNFESLSAAVASGKNIELPEGIYTVGASIPVTRDGQCIFGHGDKSIVQATSGSFDVFSVRAKHVNLFDFRINGAASTNATTQYGVMTSSGAAPYLNVFNVNFSGSSDTVGLNNGVKFEDNCDHGKVWFSKFERLVGSIAGTGYGVLAGVANDLSIGGNTGIASSGRGRHMVYLSSGCSDSVVAFNYAELFDEDAFTQYATSSQASCSRNTWIGNKAVSSCVNSTVTSGGLSVFGRAYGTRLIGNDIQYCGANGIMVNVLGATDLLSTQIIANQVEYANYFGIAMYSTKKLLLANNIVVESSRASTQIYSNIVVASDGTTTPDEVLVTGNHSTGTTTARSPFRIDSTSPTVTNIKLDGNFFPTCGFAGIETNSVQCLIDGWIRHTETYNPPAIQTNSSFIYSGISIPGAAQGDLVLATMDQNLDGITLNGFVTTTNTVSITFSNNLGSTKDVANGTLRVGVQKTDF